MDAGLLLQYVVIALAVALSAAFVLKKQFPGTIRKVRVALALSLLREGRPGWLKNLGRRIAPPGQGRGGKDCGGCSGCD